MLSSAARTLRSYSLSSGVVKRSAFARVCLRSKSAGTRCRLALGHFDVEAEDLVVANLERADSGALALAIFHGGDDLAAVLAQVAQLVELGV